MFKAAALRAAMIAAAILAVSCDKSPEYEGEGPKMEFVRIPAGSFHMGSPVSEEGRHDNEGPVHKVRITKPFYMGKYEVTQAQWTAVMGTTVRQQRDKADFPWLLKGEGPDHPIYYVAWEEAVEFCNKLGKKFRLPTEAEWEYACRAGSRTRFHYGDDPNYSELDQHAWYRGKSDNKTHPVGQKKPNALGLYDMHGNISEWCSDPYLTGSYMNAGSVDPTGPRVAKALGRVCRGGSWLDIPDKCRSASRRDATKSDRFDFIGFRVVYTGRAAGDKELVEITLPERAAKVAATSNKSKRPPRAIAGAVRDEAGLSIGDVDMWIKPIRGWILRRYPEGSFEIFWRPKDPSARKQVYHLLARNEQRNLAVDFEIEEDVNALNIKLKPGVILTGRVVNGDGKGIGEVKVRVNPQPSNWSEGYLIRVETDAEGRFEIRALPPGYAHVLSAWTSGYRPGQTEIHSDDVRDNRVDGVLIVLPRGQFSVSGVVVDVNGKPMPDVRVKCYGKDQPICNAATGADGRFTIEGVFKGQVHVTGQGYGLYGLAVAEAGATNVRIVLGKKSAPVKGRACFPGETGVWVDGEFVPISRVARGRTVGHVERIEEHEGVFECQDILLDSGNRISVVDSHCFMLDCGRWIAAQDLRAGQRLKTITGTVGIKSVTIRPTPYNGKVYNLKISDSDRYAIGKDGVIVRDY